MAKYVTKTSHISFGGVKNAKEGMKDAKAHIKNINKFAFVKAKIISTKFVPEKTVEYGRYKSYKVISSFDVEIKEYYDADLYRHRDEI
jgi:hypothetical protein